MSVLLDNSARDYITTPTGSTVCIDTAWAFDRSYTETPWETIVIPIKGNVHRWDKVLYIRHYATKKEADIGHGETINLCIKGLING